MQVPLEVTFKNTNYSDAVKEHIESKAEKLDQYSSFIISAHVIVSLENNSQTTGKAEAARDEGGDSQHRVELVEPGALFGLFLRLAL